MLIHLSYMWTNNQMKPAVNQWVHSRDVIDVENQLHLSASASSLYSTHRQQRTAQPGWVHESQRFREWHTGRRLVTLLWHTEKGLLLWLFQWLGPLQNCVSMLVLIFSRLSEKQHYMKVCLCTYSRTDNKVDLDVGLIALHNMKFTQRDKK